MGQRELTISESANLSGLLETTAEDHEDDSSRILEKIASALGKDKTDFYDETLLRSDTAQFAELAALWHCLEAEMDRSALLSFASALVRLKGRHHAAPPTH